MFLTFQILQNAIADIRTGATIIPNGDNQGDTRITLGIKPCIGSCPKTVSTILLDDIVEVATFTRAVIKIDSQGYEHRTFLHAEKLMDKIYIPYIYMEWLVMREHYRSTNHTSNDKTMVESMIKMFINRNYRPYSLDAHGAKLLDPNNWSVWPVDVVWRLMPNKHEYSKLLSNHFKIWPL